MINMNKTPSEIIDDLIKSTCNIKHTARSYDEHKAFLREIYHFVPENPRPSIDLLNITAWHTDEDNRQHFYYSSLSSPHSLGWFIPLPDSNHTEAHFHSNIELIYVMEGNITIDINGQLHTLCHNDILLINNNITHFEYLRPESSTIICLGLDDNFFADYLSSDESNLLSPAMVKLINNKRNEYTYVSFSSGVNYKNIYNCFYSLLVESASRAAGRKHIMMGYVERILDILSREYRMHISVNDIALVHDALCSDIRAYIKTNYSDITVQKLATVFGYSPDHINKIFKSHEGVTLSKYIQSIKLHEALIKITTSNDSIENIIENVGYHNQGFFYKKFQAKYGITPKQARRQIKNT